MKKFQKRHTTATRIWSKKVTQSVLKDFRNAGLIVTKIPSGYEVTNKNGVLFLQAMNGTNSYLIRAVDFVLA
tara:strand:- start:750 stop:965 length:216 start_codon:yes stop_codon:yes gene_type:complete